MTFPPDSPLVDQVRPSPNHQPRRGVDRPDILLLHYTGMATTQAALERLCDPAAKVSSHYVVFEDGRVVQLVPESRRAFHAGEFAWEGSDRHQLALDRHRDRQQGPRLRLPGISRGADRGGDRALPRHRRALVDRAVARARPFRRRAAAQARSGRGVSLGAPRRGRRRAVGRAGGGRSKARRCARATAARRSRGCSGMLADYGYGIAPSGDYDAATQEIVAAFQRHFRPARVDGLADAVDGADAGRCCRSKKNKRHCERSEAIPATGIARRRLLRRAARASQ